MSRRTKQDAVLEARKAAHEALLAEARGEQVDVEAALDQVRTVERRSRVQGAHRYKGADGFYEFDCERCGQTTIAHEDTMPVAFSKGFRPAGVCAACQRKAGA